MFPEAGIHVQEGLLREQHPPVFGQEREHAPGRDQLPAQTVESGTWPAADGLIDDQRPWFFRW
jgi:hypothetical protein